MTRTLLVASGPGELRGALVEGGRIVELRVERHWSASLVGAVFQGRVVRAVPALNAAFVEIGGAVPAFLPLDRRGGQAGGRRTGPEKAKPPPTEGSALVVQILKDARDEKPPEVTTELALEGAYLVWTPARPGIVVSHRIEPGERSRLAHALDTLVRDGEGVTLRTHGAGASDAALAADLEFLRRRHHALLAAARSGAPPARLDPMLSPLEPLLLAFRPAALDRITFDEPAIEAEARHFLKRFGGGLPVEIALDKTGDAFAEFGFEAAFEAALAPRVQLPEGPEIVIETAEACTVIDVNLAAAAGRTKGRAEDAVLAANRLAAAAIARELRLRNIGGAIVVDFISMQAREHRQAVEAALAEAARPDSAPVELHGWTRLGHLELTRRRRAASLAEIMLAPRRPPPKSPDSVAYAALRALVHRRMPPGRLGLHVAPAVRNLLEGRLATCLRDAMRRSGRRIALVPDPERDPESYEIAPET